MVRLKAAGLSQLKKAVRFLYPFWDIPRMQDCDKLLLVTWQTLPTRSIRIAVSMSWELRSLYVICFYCCSVDCEDIPRLVLMRVYFVLFGVAFAEVLNTIVDIDWHAYTEVIPMISITALCRLLWHLGHEVDLSRQVRTWVMKSNPMLLPEILFPWKFRKNLKKAETVFFSVSIFYNTENTVCRILNIRRPFPCPPVPSCVCCVWRNRIVTVHRPLCRSLRNTCYAAPATLEVCSLIIQQCHIRCANILWHS